MLAIAIDIPLYVSYAANVGVFLIAVWALIVSRRTAKIVDAEKSYADVDSLYLEVLKLGLSNPDLREKDKAKVYETAFKGVDSSRYDAYAYIVWNLCETIYDRCTSDGNLWATWRPVIKYENELHRAWLKNNLDRFKKAFRDYMDAEFPERQPAPTSL
jgi:hypothetical protein